jgi:hypothetical protein
MVNGTRILGIGHGLKYLFKIQSVSNPIQSVSNPIQSVCYQLTAKHDNFR